jgi:hypothetical protein
MLVSPLIIPQRIFAFIMIYFSAFTLEAKFGCLAYYPPFTIWIWVGVNMSHNILFSVIFSYTVYNQYKVFGAKIWKLLVRQDIQTMLLELLCNIVYTIIVTFYDSKSNNDSLVLIDC